MSEPSTAGLHEAVVGDDLRDVGVPMLLFTAASLHGPGDRRDAEPEPVDLVTAAVQVADVSRQDLDLFSTDAYLLQRVLGERVLESP